jgi:hypothetical protein
MPDPTPTPIPAPTPAATMPAADAERKILGVTLGDITKIVVTFIFASLFGAGVNYWLNTKAPHLTVAVQAPIQFHGEKTTFGIINFSVKNDGSKEAEAIECMFRTGAAKVQEVKVTPEGLNPVIALKDNKITVNIAMLNVGETLFVSTYVTEALPEKPDVSVRGKGVTGEMDSKPLSMAYAIVIGSAMGIGISLFALSVGSIIGFLLVKITKWQIDRASRK